MTKDIKRSCVDCHVTSCNAKGGGKYPAFCMTENMDSEFLSETMKLYTENEENTKIMMAASEVEFENYCKMTRVEEICEFAAKIDAKKLGIATCVGLIEEARIAAEIFRNRGFEVVGAACKVGAQTKVSVGIDPEHEKVGANMCNPILQAEILNKEETDLNVVVGLCVGHDSLFYKHSEALCTTLVTKDRVLGHNPAVALYQADKYYSKLMK